VFGFANHPSGCISVVFTKGSDAASTSQALVSAPGTSRRLVIDYFMFFNKGAAAATMELEDEDDTPVSPMAFFTSGAAGSAGGFCNIKMTANKALELEATGASDHSVVVVYHIESTA